MPNPVRFAVAVFRAATFFFRTGRIRIDSRTVEERRAVCRACPYSSTGVFRAEAFRQCQVCSCLTELKSTLITEACPKKLWKA